jgi:hypothetical protein
MSSSQPCVPISRSTALSVITVDKANLTKTESGVIPLALLGIHHFPSDPFHPHLTQ